MRRPVGYGIDFGTTNSSASIGYDNGDVELVRFGEQPRQPYSMRSLTYLDRTGQESAGEQAIRSYLITGGTTTRCDSCSLVFVNRDDQQFSDCRAFRSGSRCADGRLLAGLKSELSNQSFDSTHSWARDFEVEDLIAVSLRGLKRAADAESGESIDRVVLGHPVAFVGAAGSHFEKLQNLALTRLVEAARRAGFNDVALLEEPAAALADEELPEGFSVSVDFGGGTFDIAVIEVVDGVPEISALQGASIGGNDLDAALFDLTASKPLGLDEEIEADHFVHRFPAALKQGMRTLGGARRLMNEPQLFFTLRDLEREGIDVGPVRSVLHGGLAFGFYRAIEQAKIDLSTKDATEVYFLRRGLIALVEPVSRVDFDRAISPMIERIEEQIRLAITEAGTSLEEVAAVVRTGGSSSVPAFIDMLARLFSESDIRTRPAFTSVAMGLGMAAVQEWEHA